MAATTFIKNLMLPILLKSTKLDLTTLPDSFWDQFAKDLIVYQTDASLVYSSLYKLELIDTENVFNKLPDIFSSFIKEIAEDFVLGYSNELSDLLIENKNENFLKEVEFLNTMKSVIFKSERQNLKDNIGNGHERLLFELDEKILKEVAVKKSRNDLKEKFKQWDEELIIENSLLEPVKFSLSDSDPNHVDEFESINSKNKVISISWIKYAAAACIFLTAGIMYYKYYTSINYSQPVENNIVTAPENKDAHSNNQSISIPSEDLASINTTSTNSTILGENLGFASRSSIKIIENNSNKRISSIKKTITIYQILLKRAIGFNSPQNNQVENELLKRIAILKSELKTLQGKHNQYIFDGKSLTVFNTKQTKELSVLILENNYYLKIENTYYTLTISNRLQKFIKITDDSIIDQLSNLN